MILQREHYDIKKSIDQMNHYHLDDTGHYEKETTKQNHNTDIARILQNRDDQSKNETTMIIQCGNYYIDTATDKNETTVLIQIPQNRDDQSRNETTMIIQCGNYYIDTATDKNETTVLIKFGHYSRDDNSHKPQ